MNKKQVRKIIKRMHYSIIFDSDKKALNEFYEWRIINGYNNFGPLYILTIWLREEYGIDYNYNDIAEVGILDEEKALVFILKHT